MKRWARSRFCLILANSSSKNPDRFLFPTELCFINLHFAFVAVEIENYDEISLIAAASVHSHMVFFRSPSAILRAVQPFSCFDGCNDPYHPHPFDTYLISTGCYGNRTQKPMYLVQPEMKAPRKEVERVYFRLRCERFCFFHNIGKTRW